MANVVFYEKPGCINNTKQKRLLNESGHRVEARDLLTETWTAERLRPFFGDRPVSDWFNLTAPRVKSGDVDPKAMDEAAALAAMVDDPLLVRRPLMEVGGECRQGFDPTAVDRWIGLKEKPEESVEACPGSGGHACD